MASASWMPKTAVPNRAGGGHQSFEEDRIDRDVGEVGAEPGRDHPPPSGQRALLAEQRRNEQDHSPGNHKEKAASKARRLSFNPLIAASPASEPMATQNSVCEKAPAGLCRNRGR